MNKLLFSIVLIVNFLTHNIYAHDHRYNKVLEFLYDFNKESHSLTPTKTIERLDYYSQYLSEQFVAKLEGKSPLNGYEQFLLEKFLLAYNIVLSQNFQKSVKDNVILLNSIKVNHQSFFEKNSTLRKIVKDTYKNLVNQNEGLGNLLSISKKLTEKKFQKSLIKQLKRSSHNEIKHLPVYKTLAKGKTLKFKTYSFRDGISLALNKTMNFVSGLFGNAAGAIRWRHGHMYQRVEVAEHLKTKLRPLDIIVERTPFALTDLFIPGNFGHAALWLGTEEELKELGMWNHPSIVPYQEQIKSGMNIVEAIRPGTGLKSLEEFLEIDEIGILRVDSALEDYNEYKNIYKRAMDQIGKKYDFNFDVNTSSRIVCSELIYHSFAKVNWPTKYYLGRFTISPDQLAELIFFKDTPVGLNAYYYASNKKELQVWGRSEMAKNLGYEKSHIDDDKYLKPEKVCRTVQVRRRIGRHYRYQTQRICKKDLIEQIYIPVKDLQEL